MNSKGELQVMPKWQGQLFGKFPVSKLVGMYGFSMDKSMLKRYFSAMSNKTV